VGGRLGRQPVSAGGCEALKIRERLVRVAGGLTLAGIVLILIGGLFLGARIATWRQQDDAEHLQAKRAYLAALREQQPDASRGRGERPNLLIVLFDDLGHGDLAAFGAMGIETPRIDALAAAGLRLDAYYAPSPVCTPSRVAMLTGRYAPRANLNIVAFPTGDPMDWLMRASNVPATRVPEEEILLPEILAAVGYDTAMVGKWHLGDRSPSLPLERGFERFVGALYSNDMTPFAIYRDTEVLYDAPFDQTRMNEVYTRAAIEFLEQPREGPFFLYFAHNFPHVPLHTPESDRGRSQAGLYGDVIEGLDDSVGAILDALARRGELEDTLILLTSDNGPWFEGSPGPVRGRKGQTWEGGMHVPFIAHWPARIEGGRRSSAPVVGVDLVPTLLALLGLPTPPDRVLDGRDVGNHIFDDAPAEDRLVHYFGVSGSFDAIRDTRFKYHRRRGVRAGGGDGYSFSMPWGPWLFDLELDPAESYDVTRTHPEQAERMARIFAAEQAGLAANPRGWRSSKAELRVQP